MATCHRHPDRETGVSCSSCERPICPDCMTPTSVGMRCPECSKQRTKVKTVRSLRSDPTLTYVLIAVNALAFLGSMSSGGGLAGRGGGRVVDNGALFGPLVGDGEYWRLVTSGFLHAGFLHVAFNMYILYFLGQLLEPALGRLRFGAIYFSSLLAGSFGALLVSPDAVTVGASGAVFGLMGAAVVALRSRGFDPMSSGIPMMLLLNLGITFLIPGISIGGHVGGLIGGAAAAWLLVELGERRRSPALALLACGLLAAGVAGGAVAVAGG